MSEEPIRAVATILEPLSPVTYRIALSNGKAIVGHVGRALREDPPTFQSGERVALEMTPYDFSKARIVGLADSIPPPLPSAQWKNK